MERECLFLVAALFIQHASTANPSIRRTGTDAITTRLTVPGSEPATNERRTSPHGFEENKGQVKQTDGRPAPYVKFRLSDNGTNVFLLEHGIAYQFNRVHDPVGYAELARKSRHSSEEEARLDDLRDRRRLETYRMDMTLEGASPMARITTEGPSTDHTNYYMSGAEALDVHTFSKVIYHDVYPGIDWEIMTTGKGFEHDFIVHPGAEPSLIKMRFTGHEELYVDEGGRLIHANSLGRFVEHGPVSFQAGVVIPTAFALHGDLLTFDLDGYDNKRLLRIDPTRVWGTYYGGTANEEVKDIATDSDGKIYMAGYTESSGTNVIATDVGVHDSDYADGQDAFLVKFTATGQREWGTYYGGDNDDYFVSCAVRGPDVVAAGTTNSPDLGTAGTQQPGFAFSPEGDAMLVKFNAGNGTRQWSTYYGRIWIDIGKSCAIDPWGYIYLAGESETIGSLGGSDTIASDGFQMEMRSLVNGFLVKFDPLGSREWGTYYGGYNSYSAGFCTDVATDPFGNVVLFGSCGYNVNDGDTYVSPGAHHQLHGTMVPPGTGPDVYIAKFDSSGARLWGTFYGGSNTDNAWTGAVDGEGNIYVAGETKSDTGIFKAGNRNYLAEHELEAYMAKFDPSGALVWGTYHGGPLDEEVRSSVTDVFGHVFMVGMTRSASEVPFNGYQMFRGGGDYDAFLAGFEQEDGDLIVASYYGGSFDDRAHGVASDPDGALLMCGWTSSSNDSTIATMDGFQPFIQSSQDAYLVKFTQDCLGHPAGNQEQGTICDDDDPCTINDVYDGACVCAGAYPEAGDVEGNALLGSGIQYTFTVDPVLPDAEYEWSVPDGWTIVDSVGGTITLWAPWNAGNGSLCVSGLLGDCPLSEVCMDLLVAPVGIEEMRAAVGISVQPNPNNGQFELVCPSAQHGAIGYDVVDATGRSIGHNGSTTVTRTAIDMSGSASGVYFLRARTMAGNEVVRLVVQH